VSNTPEVKVPPISAGDVDPSQPEVGSRDHPATIKIRMRAVGIATSLSIFGIYYVVKQTGNYGWKDAVGFNNQYFDAKAEKIDQTCINPPGSTHCLDFRNPKRCQPIALLARSIDTIRSFGSYVP